MEQLTEKNEHEWKEKVLNAIPNSGGIISVIARRIGRDWSTTRNYINRWPETKEAYQNVREGISDSAESTLIKWVTGQGEEKPREWAVRYWLEHHAKDRGYDTKHEVAVMPIQIGEEFNDI